MKGPTNIPVILLFCRELFGLNAKPQSREGLFLWNPTLVSCLVPSSLLIKRAQSARFFLVKVL
jgi:hypothetical protein